MRKLSKTETKQLHKARDDFLKSLRTRIDVMIWVGDIDQFNRLLEQVEILGAYEITRIIREKGLEKELDALADKAGEIYVPSLAKKESSNEVKKQ
jgi:16S rRNA U1498 N3-methylase RsmE